MIHKNTIGVCISKRDSFQYNDNFCSVMEREGRKLRSTVINILSIFEEKREFEICWWNNSQKKLSKIQTHFTNPYVYVCNPDWKKSFGAFGLRPYFVRFDLSGISIKYYTGCFTHLDPFEMQNFRSKNFKFFSN